MPGQTLAQTVRAKYPGAYASVSDAQLEAAIDAKYPGAYAHALHTSAEAPAMPAGATAGMRPSDTRASTARERILPPFLRGGRRNTETATEAAIPKNNAELLSQLGRSWVKAGPSEVWSGLRQVATGENPDAPGSGSRAGGARRIISGTAMTAAPVAGAALMLTPAAIPAAIGYGALGYGAAKAVEAGLGAAGASPDVAGLAGDVAGLATFPGAVSATQAVSKAATARAQRTAYGLLQRAIPVSIKNTPERTSESVWRSVMPFLDEAHAATPTSSTLDIYNATHRGVGAVETRLSDIVARYQTATVATNPLAAVRATLAKSHQADAVQKGVSAITAKYPQLAKPVTLADGEGIRRELNAALDVKQAASNAKQASMAADDPVFAAELAVVRSLRDGIYGRLQGLGVRGVRELRQQEGDLIAVREASRKVLDKSDRPVGGASPLMGAAAYAGARAIGLPALGGMAARAAMLPGGLTRNAMVERAFRLKTPGTGPLLPAVPALTMNPARQLPAAAVPLPAPMEPSAGPMVQPQPAAMLRVPRGQLALPPPAGQQVIAGRVRGQIPTPSAPLRPNLSGPIQGPDASYARGAQLTADGLLEYRTPVQPTRTIQSLAAPPVAPVAPPVHTPVYAAEQGAGAPVGEAGRTSINRVSESVPRGYHETPTAESARRTAHYADVFDAVSSHARTLDPAVDLAKVRAEFDARVNFLEAMDWEFIQSGHSPRTLLEAIAKHGGLSIEAERDGGLTGELRHLRENAAGPHGNFAGVAGVFRQRRLGDSLHGVSVDEMVTRLRQDPEFAHIESTDDLITALDDASRLGHVGVKGQSFPGTDELAKRAGISSHTRWWDESWFGDGPQD